MLKIKIPVHSLCVGDIVCDTFTDGIEERVTSAPIPDASGLTWETDKHHGQHRWVSTTAAEATVVFSSALEFAASLLNELQRIPPEVLLDVRRAICAQCGKIGCKEHM